jgi:hypothetical protein
MKQRAAACPVCAVFWVAVFVRVGDKEKKDVEIPAYFIYIK